MDTPSAHTPPADTPRLSLRTRLALALEPRPVPLADAPPPPKRLMLRESWLLVEPLTRPFRRRPVVRPAAQPQVILLLPGFAAHPNRMRYMAQEIERAGHTVRKWGLGTNLGANAQVMETLSARLDAVRAEHGGARVVLLGWSLGGIIARELAKQHPDKVAKVITLGSPFSGPPYANNAWRAIQAVTGHRVTEPPVDMTMHEKPPVETVALWSARDGIAAPHAARGQPGERDRAVEVGCTHMGFAYAAESIEAVLAELERAEAHD